MSRLGLSAEQFFESTPIEIHYALKASDDLEQYRMQGIMETIRLNTVQLINLQLKKSKQYRKASDLYKFHWEVLQDKVQYKKRLEMNKPESPEQLKEKLMAIFGGKIKSK